MDRWVWWILAEWRVGPWKWLIPCLPLVYLGLIALPDPIGYDQGPEAFAGTLIRLVLLVGWATSAARRQDELPTWPQRPWERPLGLLMGALATIATVHGVGALCLLASGHPGAVSPTIAETLPWSLQAAPWVILLTCVIGATGSPWAILLLPLVGAWIDPTLQGTMFHGWLPAGSRTWPSMDVAVRQLLLSVALLSLASMAGKTRRRVPPIERVL